jgi:hypothetical protein
MLTGITLAAAFAAYADQTTVARDEYVFWVETSYLMEHPSGGAEIVAKLKRGDKLIDLGEAPVESGGFWWRHVRAGGNEGWVNDWLALPRAYYDAFREADELGKAGDAEAMVASVIETAVSVGIGEMESYEPFYDVSPDGKRVIIKGCLVSEEADYWGGRYEDMGRVSSPSPVLVFASGKGLIDYFRSYDEISGKWSADSRYCAYSARPVVTHFATGYFGLIDTDRGKRVGVGRMVPVPRSEEVGFGDFEFADGYLVWVDEEPVDESASPLLYGDSSTPVLYARELVTGRKLKLLEADLSTIGGEDTRTNWARSPCYPVKMNIVDPCPEGVERSKLYIKYYEDSGYAINRTHQFE